MRLSPLSAALVAIALPLLASAQNENVQVHSIRADEQVLLGQIMTEKRTIYAQTMGLTDKESRAFWPIYDEYEARVKKLDDRLISLLNEYEEKYYTMSDVDAKQMLGTKMKLDRERMELQHAYTKKIAKALPAVKTLRYAQIESRIDNELQRKVLLLIPLVP